MKNKKLIQELYTKANKLKDLKGLKRGLNDRKENDDSDGENTMTNSIISGGKRSEHGDDNSEADNIRFMDDSEGVSDNGGKKLAAGDLKKRKKS